MGKENELGNKAKWKSTKYFPDIWLVKPSYFETTREERYRKLYGLSADPYDPRRLKSERSKVYQTWAGAGGSCHVQSVLYGLLEQLGEEEFRKRFLSVGEPEEDKVTVHFYWDGKPYDVVIDNTIITVGGDFVECSVDVRLIMKAFVMAGLGTGNDKLVTDLNASEVRKEEMDFHYLARGGSPAPAMKAFSGNLNNLTDKKREKKLTDDIKNLSDIKDIVVKRLVEWNEDKTNIVVLGITYLDGHAVTLKDVDVEQGYITIHDQMKDITRRVSFDELMNGSTKDDTGLIEAYCFKKDEKGSYTNFEEVEVRTLKNSLRKKGIAKSKEDVIKAIRSRFKSIKASDKVSSYVEKNPDETDKIIEKFLSENKIDWRQWNNYYDLEKMLDALSGDVIYEQEYSIKKKIMDGIDADITNKADKLNNDNIALLKQNFAGNFKEYFIPDDIKTLETEMDHMLSTYRTYKLGSGEDKKQAEQEVNDMKDTFSSIIGDYVSAGNKISADKLNKFWKFIGHDSKYKDDLSAIDTVRAVQDIWTFLKSFTWAFNNKCVVFSDKGTVTLLAHYQHVVKDFVESDAMDGHIKNAAGSYKTRMDKMNVVSKVIDEELKAFIDENMEQFKLDDRLFKRIDDTDNLEQRRIYIKSFKDRVNDTITNINSYEDKLKKSIELVENDIYLSKILSLKDKIGKCRDRLLQVKENSIGEKNRLEEAEQRILLIEDYRNSVKKAEDFVNGEFAEFIAEIEKAAKDNLEKLKTAEAENDLEKRKNTIINLKEFTDKYINKISNNMQKLFDLTNPVLSNKNNISDTNDTAMAKEEFLKQREAIKKLQSAWSVDLENLKKAEIKVGIDIEIEKFNNVLKQYENVSPQELRDSISNGMKVLIDKRYKPYIEKVRNEEIKRQNLLSKINAAATDDERKNAFCKLQASTDSMDRQMSEYEAKFYVVKTAVVDKLKTIGLSLPEKTYKETVKCYDEVKSERVRISPWVTDKLLKSMEEFNIVATEHIPWNQRHPAIFNAIRTAIRNYQDTLKENGTVSDELNEQRFNDRIDAAAALYKACRDYLNLHMKIKNAGTPRSLATITGQGNTEGRMRKQVVVKLLEIFDNQKLWSEHPAFRMAQDRYKELLQQKHKNYVELNYQQLHSSLAASTHARITPDMSLSQKAYAELEVVHKNDIKPENAVNVQQQRKHAGNINMGV